MSILSLILLPLLCWLIHQFYLRRRGLPPGPMPLPIIGNFYHIDLCYPHRSMVKWYKIYGGIFTIWIPKPVVVIVDHKLLDEALIKRGDVFSGRPASFIYGIFSHHQKDGDGIILSQRHKWSKQRRFAQKVFRDFGVGKNLMETKITHHCNQLIQLLYSNIQPNKSRILDLHASFAFCVGNIIQDIVLGICSPYGDEKFHRFKELLDSTLKEFASFEILMIDSYPWMRYILPKYARYVKNGFALQNYFLEHIAQHEANLTPDDDEPLDFIEAYIKNIRSKTGSNEFDRISLALSSGDLWTGGMETTVTTLRWAIIYLIYEPEIQERLYNEILKVLGSRQVTWSDRLDMPFNVAFSYEVLRVINILPWLIPHSTTFDVNFHGYHFPEGTTVIVGAGALHFDEKIFPDPERFNPHRFLNEDGSLRAIPEFIPFGIGRRSCLGEPLARMELFIILSTLIQHFRFGPAHGFPSMKRRIGMTNVPADYFCSVDVRQSNRKMDKVDHFKSENATKN